MPEVVESAEQVQSLASPGDDGDFFFNPQAVADAQFAKTEPQEPKPVANRKPEAKGVAPPPSHQSIPEPLFDLAETLGVSREEAKALGTPEALSRTLAILRKQQTASRVKEQQLPPQPPPKEDPPFDEAAFQSDEWLPELKQMASVVARLEKQNRELSQQVRQLTGIEGSRQNEQGKSMFHGAVKDLGFGSILSDPAKEQRLLARTNGLAEMYRNIGEKIPQPKDLVEQAAKLLGLTPQRAQAPATQKPRHANGVGAPTHRRFEMERPSRLAQNLTDLGVDPGPERQEVDYSFFLGQ